MTCRDCNWIVLISRVHLHKGDPQVGLCKRHFERMEADAAACGEFTPMNENVSKVRRAVAAYNRTRKKGTDTV